MDLMYDLGGIMFSIEVTSTYYAQRSYWFAVAASSVGGLLFKILWGLYRHHPGGESINTPVYVSLLSD
jgi:hypothetical protein